MSIKLSILLFVFISIIAFVPSLALAQSPDDILIIANRDVGDNAISVEVLASLFSKERLTWSNGVKVVPIHAKDPVLKTQFLQSVLGLSLAEDQRYWKEQRIKKGVSPPPEFSNTLKAVFKLKGAVSYLYRAQYRDNVSKILLVLPVGPVK